MRKMKIWTKYIPLLVGLLMMVACSGDKEGGDILPIGIPVTAKFCVITYDGPAVSRAWDGTTSPSLSGEKMQNWVAVVVNNADGDDKDKVEAVLTKSGLGDVASDDVAIEETAEVFTGPKRVYTFANITPANLETALGLAAGDISSQALVGKTLADVTVKAATFAPQGNNWTATQDAEGIPMSNWQEINITKDNETHVLYVCRMIAKLEFQFQNLTGQSVTIKNLAINDITANESRISLMPSGQVTPTMGSGTLKPQLTESRAVEEVSLFADAAASVELASGGISVQTLYVNESQVSASSRYGLFRLTLTIDRGEGEEELRYALVSNEGENWTYISRNDHRIIPILIEDYKLDLIPVDFPPIAVYPSSVKEEDGVFTCTFHAGGDFELIPVVTRYSTGTELPYGIDANQWNYVADSWTTPVITPTGAENTSAIYEVAPAWDGTHHIVSGKFNDILDEAYHEMEVKVNKGSGAQRTLPYRVWVIRK